MNTLAQTLEFSRWSLGNCFVNTCKHSFYTILCRTGGVWHVDHIQYSRTKLVCGGVPFSWTGQLTKCLQLVRSWVHSIVLDYNTLVCPWVTVSGIYDGQSVLLHHAVWCDPVDTECFLVMANQLDCRANAGFHFPFNVWYWRWLR